MNPDFRWSPHQALQHSFVNPEVEYNSEFQPPKDDLVPSVTWAPPWQLTGLSGIHGTLSGTSACSSASSAASTPRVQPCETGDSCTGAGGGRGGGGSHRRGRG